MARFDVFQVRGGVALDCQADVLRRMPSRFVVPLERPHPDLLVDEQLNPLFEVAGEKLAMITQLAGTIRAAELKSKLGSLDEEDRYAAQRALDLLMTGV